MRKEIIIQIALIISLPILGFISGTLCEKHKIDLPEEINLISGEFHKPDTLIGYMDKNNTLHLGFKH